MASERAMASDETREPVLALPSSESAGSAAAATDDEVQTITVNGDPVTVDKLGPVVINADGTISRITNWHDMTAAEQQRTLRVIGKRNRSRTAALKKAAAAAEEGQSAAGAGADE